MVSISWCLLLGVQEALAFSSLFISPTKPSPLASGNQDYSTIERRKSCNTQSWLCSTTNGNNNQHLEEDFETGIGVGIDLGTTHSAIAYLHPETGLPTIIPIPQNGRTMPSVVTFLSDKDDDDDEQVLVGKPAIAKEAQQGSYRNVKRILGQGATAALESSDVVPFVVAATSSSTHTRQSAQLSKRKKFQKKTKQQRLSKRLREAQENPAMLYAPFRRTDTNNNDHVSVISPTDISAHILKTLLHTAQQHTGQTVTRAVIGVPAYFHDAQREATLQAAKMAGISKVKLLREPEAAALAYGVGKQQIFQERNNTVNYNYDDDDDGDDDEELVLVFDLGGGTYDVSMLLVGGGLSEIITTSGDSQLGGSDFDSKVAQHLRKVMADHGLVLSSSSSSKRMKNDDDDGDTCSATDAIVRSAEMVRIYLSNNRRVKMALPLMENDWRHMQHASDIILPLNFTMEDGDGNQLPLTLAGISNSTHVLCELTRREMEKLCQDELLALLRPIREVAIMAGALLPGDTSPTIVEAAMEMDEEREDSLVFEDFYKEEDGEKVFDSGNDLDDDRVDQKILLQLKDSLNEINVKEQKRTQQQGRKKARDVTKRERKYRQEKRKLREQVPPSEATDVKVRDGISGRPISRVVLVGGATRMPAIGRLIAALTGVVPQKTVNPDEAVALGCAIHVGVLDGKEDMGTVLNPMQAAILRAVAEQQQKQGLLSEDFDFDEEDEAFDSVEYF